MCLVNRVIGSDRHIRHDSDAKNAMWHKTLFPKFVISVEKVISGNEQYGGS